MGSNLPVFLKRFLVVVRKENSIQCAHTCVNDMLIKLFFRHINDGIYAAPFIPHRTKDL